MFNAKQESTSWLFIEFVCYAVLTLAVARGFYKMFDTYNPFQLSTLTLWVGFLFVLKIALIVYGTWKTFSSFRKAVCKFIPCSV